MSTPSPAFASVTIACASRSNTLSTSPASTSSVRETATAFDATSEGRSTLSVVL